MADVTLSDGREVTFDLMKMTVLELRGVFDPKQEQADEDATVARVAGMTVAEYLALPYPDFRRVVKAFFAKIREPLADPN